MAKDNGKSEKANKTAREASVKIDDEDEDDEDTLKVTKASKVEIADDDSEDEKKSPAPVPSVAQIKPNADLVSVAMYVDCDPAPTIGHPAHGGYSFVEHGITKLNARESYIVPRRVAEHLVDKKLAGFANN
jgi:hypothetical protein